MNTIVNVFTSLHKPYNYYPWIWLKVSDQMFNGVPVRVYKPVDSISSGQGILYIHGGGWMFGSPGKTTLRAFLN